MPLIATEDYPNRRIYLSIDSVGVDVLPVALYTEHRQRRRLNANGERLFSPMISAFGNEQIGSNKFTPRFTNLASGVKIIPYDTTHNLLIRGSLISTEDRLEGRDLFDRASLLSIVDVDYQPPQVEILTVNTGSGFTATQDDRLRELWQSLESAGVFSTAALANAPSGSSGGDATLLNQTAILSAISALPTLNEMEASDQLTAIADLSAIQTALASVATDAKAAKNYSAANL